jgi:hypothetical protein
MSTPPMQWMSDVEAKLAQLSAQNKSQPNNLELVDAIGARIAREGQTLREDFIGKFAASFLLATETITKRVVELEEKQTKLEEREQVLEEKTAAHEAKVTADLDKAEERLTEIFSRFITALNQHHQVNATTLSKQQLAVEECQRATKATATATSLCTSFASDYQATVKRGGMELEELAQTLRDELQEFVRGVKKETSAMIAPAIKKARDITEEEYLRRMKWIMVGVMIVLFITGGLTWLAQPSPSMMRDAASWRSFQGELNQDQADRINKVLNEVQEQQRAAEEKKNQ